MSVVATEIVIYSSSNVPEDDTTTTGGSIIITSRPVFSTGQMSGDQAIQVASTDGTNDGGGTKRVTITGRDSGGTIVSENILVNSSDNTYTEGSTTFERILKAVLNDNGTPFSATGTVTVRGADSTVFTTISPAEQKRHVLFYDSSSSASGEKNRYEKIFLKNTNATTDLTQCTVELSAEPADAGIIDWQFGIDATGTITDRETDAVGEILGGTWVSDTAADTISGEVGTAGILAASEAQSIWIRQNLDQDEPALNTTFTLTVTGSTT